MACTWYLFKSSFSRWPVGAARLVISRSSSSKAVWSFSPGRRPQAPRPRRAGQQVAAYYVKPKRRGVSGEAVLMLLGGTVALGMAGVFFMGEGLRAVACVCARDLLKAVCRVQGVAVECKCVSILRRPTGGRTGRECSGELRASVATC